MGLIVAKIRTDGKIAWARQTALRCDRVVRFEELLEAGLYCFLPMSVQQDAAELAQRVARGPSAQPQTIVLNVLSEHDGAVTPLPWDCLPNGGVNFPVNSILFIAIRDHPRTVRKEHKGIWTSYTLRRGSCTVYAFASRSRHVTKLEYDPSESTGVTVVPAFPRAGTPAEGVPLGVPYTEKRTVWVPPGHAVVVAMTTVLAHQGGYQCVFHEKQGMAEEPGVGSDFLRTIPDPGALFRPFPLAQLYCLLFRANNYHIVSLCHIFLLFVIVVIARWQSMRNR